MSRETKILIVTDVLENICGGAEKQIFLLSTGLAKRGWDVSVLVLQSECKDVSLFEENGVKVYVENIKRVYGIEGWRVGRIWSRRIRQENFSAILSYHFGSDLWCSMFLSMPAGVKWFSMRRDDGFWMKWYHRLVYRCIINRNVFGICVVANFMKKNISYREKIKENKIWVVYNGVEMERYQNRGQQEEFGDKFVVVYVANLSQVKNHRLLIEAAEYLRESMPDFQIWFVGGDEGMRASLEKMVCDKSLTDIVKFLGLRKDIPQILHQSSVCVLASLSEGMSNTLLEYMAAGKPVLCSDIPSNREVVGDAGLYFPPLDVHSFCNRLIQLYNDVQLRLDLSNAAKERVKRFFSVESMLDRYETLIMEGKL